MQKDIWGEWTAGQSSFSCIWTITEQGLLVIGQGPFIKAFRNSTRIPVPAACSTCCVAGEIQCCCFHQAAALRFLSLIPLPAPHTPGLPRLSALWLLLLNTYSDSPSNPTSMGNLFRRSHFNKSSLPYSKQFSLDSPLLCQWKFTECFLNKKPRSNIPKNQEVTFFLLVCHLEKIHFFWRQKKLKVTFLPLI